MQLKQHRAATLARKYEAKRRRTASEAALHDFIGNARTFRVHRIEGDAMHCRRGDKIVSTSALNGWARIGLIQMTSDDPRGRSYRRVR